MTELPISPGGRRYGFRPSPPDHRDFGAMRIRRVGQLPPTVDLEAWCGAKRDQGNLGACTAFAGCGMLEFLLAKYDRDYLSAGPEFVPTLSPLFLYYKERELDGSLADGDTGSYGRTSCMAMQKFGVCPEPDDSYDPAKFNVAPTQDQLLKAIPFRSGAYHRLYSVDDMKSCLASGYVFVIGFTVYESFETRTDSTKVYLPNKARESVMGGHEVLVIGYDDAKFGGAFKIRNSWGAAWADAGNFWFPYSVAADQDILSDAWIQHLGKPW